MDKTVLAWYDRRVVHCSGGLTKVDCLSLCGDRVPTGITITTSPDAPGQPKYGTLNLHGRAVLRPGRGAVQSEASKLAAAKVAGEHAAIVLLAWRCGSEEELEMRWLARWPTTADLRAELQAKAGQVRGWAELWDAFDATEDVEADACTVQACQNGDGPEVGQE